MPHGSSVSCRHRAPCKPSSVIGTSVSLRRIDRACYQDRCDVHSDTSERHTFSHPPGRKTLSTRATRRRPHSKPLVGQACCLVRCRRAHCARFGRWRSQKHRWWPSAGVSGGGRDLTLRADDPTSLEQPNHAHWDTQLRQPNPTPNNPTQSTILKLGPGRAAAAIHRDR